MKQFIIQNITTRSYYKGRDVSTHQPVFMWDTKQAATFSDEESAENVIAAILPSLPKFENEPYQAPYVLTVLPVFIR